MVACICNSSDIGQQGGSQRWQTAKAYWPASIAESMGFEFSERLCLKKLKTDLKTWYWSLAFKITCVQILVCANVQTHTNVYSQRWYATHIHTGRKEKSQLSLFLAFVVLWVLLYLANYFMFPINYTQKCSLFCMHRI